MLNMVLLHCPEVKDLREEMWERKRVTYLTRLLGDPKTAKRAANFLLAAGEFFLHLGSFRHANELSSEENALEHVTKRGPNF